METKMKQLTFVFAMLVVTAVTGCDKRVEITFTNISSSPAEVQLNGPGEGTGLLGTMGGTGGRVRTEIKVSKSLLPAHYTWNAGPWAGGFTIKKKTQKELWIDVGTKRGPRDKYTEIKEYKENTRTITTQEEVVTPD